MALAMKNAGVGDVAVAPHQRRDSLVLHPWSMPPSAVVLGQNQQEEKPLEEWYQVCSIRVLSPVQYHASNILSVVVDCAVYNTPGS